MFDDRAWQEDKNATWFVPFVGVEGRESFEERGGFSLNRSASTTPLTIYEEDWTALLADPIYVSDIYTHMCMCIRTYSCLAAHVSLRLRLSDISDQPTQHYPSQQLQLRLKIPFCRSKEPSSCSYTVSVLEYCTYKLLYKPV